MKLKKNEAKNGVLHVVGMIIFYKTTEVDFLYHRYMYQISKNNFYRMVKRAIHIIEEYKVFSQPLLNIHTEQSALSQSILMPTVTVIKQEPVVEQVKKQVPAKTMLPAEIKPTSNITGSLELVHRSEMGETRTPFKKISNSYTVEDFINNRYDSFPEGVYKTILGYRIITDHRFMSHENKRFELNDYVSDMTEDSKNEALTEWLYGLYSIEDDIETEKELELLGTHVDRSCIKGMCCAATLLSRQVSFTKSIRNRYSIDGKLINNFPISREWRKGSGTRKYIAAELKEIKKEYSQKLNKSEEEVDALITKALSEWSYPIEKVRTRAASDQGFDEISIEYYEKELKQVWFIPELDDVKKMSKEQIMIYIHSISAQMAHMFLVAIATTSRNRAIFNEMSDKLGMTLGEFEESIARLTTREIRKKEEKKFFKVIDVIERQKFSIIHYNIEIDNDKLEFVKKYLNATV